MPILAILIAALRLAIDLRVPAGALTLRVPSAALTLRVPAGSGATPATPTYPAGMVTGLLAPPTYGATIYGG